MKRLFLGLVLLGAVALMAGSAHAYTKTSPAPTVSAPSTSEDPSVSVTPAPVSRDLTLGSNHHHNGGDDDSDRRRTPTRPVPEPGTMILASMGLIALGTAAHQRRKRG
jgi:hypothetical protein